MTIKNKIIFLDIDGVLNNIGQYYNERKVYISNAAELDKTAIGILRFICDCTGAKIVISSTWRLLNKDTAWFKGMFNSYGWYDVDVIGLTPDKHHHRGNEIAEWVSNHRRTIDTYVIVDDDTDMLPDQPFVHVDNIVGLTLYNAVDIIEILGIIPSELDRYTDIKKQIDFKRSKQGK